MSKLYYTYGSMSSAKTTILLTKAHAFSERNIPFLCLKSTIDDRDGHDVIKSRAGLERPCISIEPYDNIKTIIEEYIANAQMLSLDIPKWIFIDECQFLTQEQVDQLADIVDLMDINVMCYGLRTDFQTHFFEGARRLMEIADTIEEVKTSCACGRKAIVNARFNDKGEVIIEGEQVLVGGDDVYVPLCRKCFREKVLNK